MTQRKLSFRPHWHRIQHQTPNNIVEQTLKATINMPAIEYSIHPAKQYRKKHNQQTTPGSIAHGIITPAMPFCLVSTPFCLVSTNKTSYCSHFDWEGHAPLVADARDKSNPCN